MNLITKIFDTEGFPPRWRCGTAWQEDPSLGWLHITSDLVTWIAYLMIPCVLVYFVLKRKELVFPRIFWLFGLFIFACGTVHLLEAITFWVPLYRLSALVKLLTAVVSTATVIALIRIAPQAIRLPGLAQANERLTREAVEREIAEKRLRDSNKELEKFTENVLDREDRMIELKCEVNKLLNELGLEPRYAQEA